MVSACNVEFGAMDLLHRIGNFLQAKRCEYDVVAMLMRLDDHALADLGLVRDEVRPVAKYAGSIWPAAVPMRDVIRRVKGAEAVRLAEELGNRKPAFGLAGYRSLEGAASH